MRWGLREVTVIRGRAQALAGVTVPVDPAGVTVVVGGDGAGKSTCLQVLAGLLQPSQGTVLRPPKERIGYVPATAGLYADLTVQENLDFSARAYRLAGRDYRQRAQELLEQTGLGPARRRLGGQLSGGMQRKLAVAMALLHAPDLLVLDEPTTGVDPVSRAELWRLISAAAADGTAVAVSTTYVNEAARAALVVLLEAGRTAASGTPAQILDGFPGRLGVMGGDSRPAPLSWRRGVTWRVWAPDGLLPAGARPAAPDFEDAVVAAALAGQRSGQRRTAQASGQDRRDDAMEYLAETRQVVRRFARFTAVSGVDLTVRPGEIVGLLGANGAGKTTLIRLLLGLLPPNGGVVHLFGEAPSIATRRRVGYVPQTLGLYAGLTVRENWDFTAAAFGSTGLPLPGDIAAWRGQLVGRLPLGAQRQVAFAVALSHRPELLVLDEPTSGVGPLGSARLWEGIRQAAGAGAGALVTTHNMEEAEQCDRLMIMVDGKVVASGTAQDIAAGRDVTEVRSADWSRAFTVLDDGGFPVQLHGTTLRSSGQPAEISGLLSSAGIEAAVASVPANLEEAFVAIVAGPAAR